VAIALNDRIRFNLNALSGSPVLLKHPAPCSLGLRFPARAHGRINPILDPAQHSQQIFKDRFRALAGISNNEFCWAVVYVKSAWQGSGFNIEAGSFRINDTFTLSARPLYNGCFRRSP
jgi:hypothetical protein